MNKIQGNNKERDECLKAEDKRKTLNIREITHKSQKIFWGATHTTTAPSWPVNRFFFLYEMVQVKKPV